MSAIGFAWVLFGGAAMLALWLAIRFPSLAPTTGGGVTWWLTGAIVAFVATPPAVVGFGTLFGAVAAAMLVALPGSIVIMLGVAWLMLWVARVLQPHRH